MQYSTLLLAALLPALGLAAPAGQSVKASSSQSGPSKTSGGAKAAATSGAPTGKAGNNTAGSGQGQNGVSDIQLLNAVNGWMNDTGKVTNFLNTATSLTGDDYTVAATIALNAEKDELNHKAVLDAGLDPTTIAAANDTLATQGNFQAVVDALQAMVNEGPETAQQRVTEINNNRCVNVLPNINAYMAAAGQPMSSAVVPTGCLEVAATNPGSVVPSGAPIPGNNNNNGTQNPITSAPASGPTSAALGSSSSSSASTSTAAAGSNGNNNNNNNNNNNGNNNNNSASATSTATTGAGNRAKTTTKAAAANKTSAAAAKATPTGKN